jgi:hypothetical protein
MNRPYSESFVLFASFVVKIWVHFSSDAALAGLRKGGALGSDYTHELVP